MFLPLHQYGPAAAGLILALVVWSLTRRSRAHVPAASRVPAAVGMLIALGCIIVYSSWIVFPAWMPALDEDGHLAVQLIGYLLPLVLTAVALLLLVWPIRPTGPRGSAELAPRTLRTFASRPWSAALAVVIASVLAVSVVAGLASTPDEDGRHLLYSLAPSGEFGSSTTIYGWWFSVPCRASPWSGSSWRSRWSSPP